MKKKALRMAVLILCLCAGCISCAKAAPDTAEYAEGFAVTYGQDSISASFFAFDTYMTVTVYGKGELPVDGKDLEALYFETQRLEKLFSVTDPESELYAFNHRSGDRAEVSEETAQLAAFAKEMSERTGWAVDIAAYPIVSAWGFTTGEYRIPSEAELKELTALCGEGSYDIEGRTLKAREGTELDLGAVAKGYLCDRLTAMLKDAGVTCALLDLGGNIGAVGTKTDGSPWKIGIRDPLDSSGLLGYVSVSDAAVVTSGGYERYFTGEDGNIYWHIIDTSTGRPAHSGIISATVVGSDAAVCDALSTAFFIMGAEGAENYRAEYGAEYVLVTEDGQVIVSEGLQDKLVLY